MYEKGCFQQAGRGDGAGPLPGNQTGGAFIDLELSGGEFSIGEGPGATGLWEVSGGSISVRFLRVGHSTGGEGTFRVVGAGPTSIQVTGDYQQFTNSTLAMVVDTNGVTEINVTGGQAVFDPGSILDMRVPGKLIVKVNETFDILSANTIQDSGLTVADKRAWSFEILGTAGSGQTLQAKYLLRRGSVLIAR